VAVGRQRFDAARESNGRGTSEARDGGQAVADVDKPLEDRAKESAPFGGAFLEGGDGLGVPERGEEMIGGVVGNMIAKGQGGVRVFGDANEALMSLDLAKGASSQTLYPRFKIGP
jgi:hypothetical protein